MKELRYQYLNQSAYDKKVNINLRNSQMLKKSKKKRPRSRFRNSSHNVKNFNLDTDNSIQVTQNFSMVKGKARGLENSVLGHSQFVNFNKDQLKKESEISNELPCQFFPKKQPQDYLDKVLNLEHISQYRTQKTTGTPKYQPDLVEMVKNIFGPKDVVTPSDSPKVNFLFESSPQVKNTSYTRNQSNKTSSFQYSVPNRNAFDFSSFGGNLKRKFGNQIDCSDVLQHIRQRQLYRKPLQLFHRN